MVSEKRRLGGGRAETMKKIQHEGKMQETNLISTI